MECPKCKSKSLEALIIADVLYEQDEETGEWKRLNIEETDELAWMYCLECKHDWSDKLPDDRLFSYDA